MMKRKIDPTLADVMDSVNTLTTAVQKGFQGVEKKFEGVEKRLDRLEIRQSTHDSRMERVEVEIRGMSRRLGAVEVELGDVHETVNAIADAVDKDALTIINHEKRIGRLEAVSA